MLNNFRFEAAQLGRKRRVFHRACSRDQEGLFLYGIPASDVAIICHKQIGEMVDNVIEQSIWLVGRQDFLNDHVRQPLKALLGMEFSIEQKDVFKDAA